MLGILIELGMDIELPAGHAASGRTLPVPPPAGGAKWEPLIRVRSGTLAPGDAHVAVPYRGSWYWIDDTDLSSKRTFTFLMILFSLAETGQTSVAPVVTVPSR